MSGHFDPRKDSDTLRRATRAFVEALLEDVIDDLRLAARGCGYALAVHGSMARDIDIVAVPWTEQADNPEFLIERLCGALAGKVGRGVYRRKDHRPDWTEKPHGRWATTIMLPGMGPEIDLSVMPRIEKDDE